MIGLSTYVLVLGHLKVGLFALSFALIILAIMVYLAFVIKRVELLLTLLSRGYEDNKIKNSFFYSKGTLALITNYYLQHSRESLLEDKRRHAEYLVLQNQINPHFLYNTLEAIRSEALIGGLPQVADMSETLAKFFRYTISNTEDLVNLEDEIRNVQDYFSIQCYRFGFRIKLELDSLSLDQFSNYRLPKLVLQPIVENSIIHGLESKIEGGTVRIFAQEGDESISIAISDDGVGMDTEQLEKLNKHLSEGVNVQNTVSRRGIAIINVDKRLKLLYGIDWGLSYYSALNGGTTVIIRLPKKELSE